MEEAPLFTLQDTQGKPVKLESFRDEKNVVLLFFPLAFSEVCTNEMCSVRDNMKMFDALEAEVMGISVDSFFTLRAFKESKNLNFKLLSDFNKEVSTSYGALYDDFYGMQGVAKRSAFVIDKKGRIVYKEILDNADEQPDYLKIQSVLAELD